MLAGCVWEQYRWSVTEMNDLNKTNTHIPRVLVYQKQQLPAVDESILRQMITTRELKSSRGIFIRIYCLGVVGLLVLTHII